jgi:ATP-dependent RNA helicase DeaD
VAARGIDLPSLSLVVHVETPRDAEALQHRSGRTGRAGRKGIAVLLVPYPQRRRVDRMLKDARIAAEWLPAPSAADIRQADSERLLAKLLAPVEADDEDRALAAELLKQRSPEDIAAALVSVHRAALPQPEELLAADAAPGPRAPRAGFEGSAWFRMNVGRSQNADPRWVLPLLCRRGHVGRGEIGAIRITTHETLFEVQQAVAARFLAAVRRTANDEDDGLEIIAVEGQPREEARHNRRDANQSRPRPHSGPKGKPGPRHGEDAGRVPAGKRKFGKPKGRA